jgi:hypothetical protein
LNPAYLDEQNTTLFNTSPEGGDRAIVVIAQSEMGVIKIF